MRGVGLGDFCAEDVRKRKKEEGKRKNTAILNSKLKNRGRGCQGWKGEVLSGGMCRLDAVRRSEQYSFSIPLKI